MATLFNCNRGQSCIQCRQEIYCVNLTSPPKMSCSRALALEGSRNREKYGCLLTEVHIHFLCYFSSIIIVASDKTGARKIKILCEVLFFIFFLGLDFIFSHHLKCKCPLIKLLNCQKF